MKFLCLPGSYGSAQNFKVQLGPFADGISSSCKASFKWTQGNHRAEPPEGFEDYFGPGPLYRFVDFDGIEGFDSIQEKIRDFPDGHGAEDTLRTLIGDGTEAIAANNNVREAIDDIFRQIDEDPEIEGVLGYSEGATIAATLVLEERRRLEEQEVPRRIKCAIFVAGWPPLSITSDGVRTLLADECEDVVDIPTCHIVGCNDPYIVGSTALYNMCDEDTAELVDHGRGHVVPRDPRTIGELGEAISRLIGRAST
ncbi:hypothetical protein K490DRAFT_39979 [Saccharata proteae CBS 121410]|uniref:Serine hydrolase domain-containing protein n=1 Tax=Saccharata proteae CBS 121410 TaxID=1314787 RepID=A0A9P4LXU5_9PEZI|nr:hypothetical protein K490DRAFT_39979 [Saccharata proteae CBS 121410]